MFNPNFNLNSIPKENSSKIKADKLERLQAELLDYQTANESELSSDQDENQKSKRIDLFWGCLVVWSCNLFVFEILNRRSHAIRSYYCYSFFKAARMSSDPIRLQCKTNSGKHVLKGLTQQSTVAGLKQLISKVTDIPSDQQKIFYGYPPKPVDLSDDNLQLSGCSFRSGDLLIVEENLKGSSAECLQTVVQASVVPVKSERKQGMLIRKVVPANNSCLFTSVYTVMNNGVVDLSCSEKMRLLTAQMVMNDPDTYSTAFLGQENSKYCKWILKEDSWGGGIELSVLSKYFNVEIDLVDTQSGRIDQFGEDQKYDKRVLLIYNGIHYDPLVFEASDSSITTIFSTDDDWILQQALEIAADAKANQQYTDVNKFSLRCLVCQTQLIGQLQAQQHAEETGHINFGQI